jgi:hypothetical protein
MPGDPLLSVVIVTPDCYETIRITMRHLRAQTARQSIEIVILGPSRDAIRPPAEDLLEFHSHQLIALGTVASIGRANAAGVRHARAPIVALAEDHCFPEPGWAAALLAAHQQPCTVVGPVFRNANPRSIVSWCDFVIGYGPWMHPAPAQCMPFLPGHNSSYKRSALLESGPRLEAMMESETVLHLDLTRRGHQLRLEPAARTAHTNFALLSSWLPVQFFGGRVFGGSRAAAWPVAKRLVYFAASPLIPAVRLFRCLRELAKPGRPARRIPAMLPLLALGLALDGLGQMTGYLFGLGDSVARVAAYEFHRFQHITAADRAEIIGPRSSSAESPPESAGTTAAAPGRSMDSPHSAWPPAKRPTGSVPQ